jgi:opacity protein-like surface antigen
MLAATWVLAGENRIGIRIGGATDLFQTIDTFDEAGSFFAGVQGGYNYVLPNRILLGAEVDASFPAFQSLPSGVNPFGVSVGGISTFTSPTLGAVSFAETVLSSGTVRGRIGYAPGHWLFYATGGFAWAYNRQSLAQVATGNTDTPFLWRLGWAAGGGVEVPIAPHWTARLEYLYTGYGNHNTAFFAGAQPINSDFSVQEVRAGVDYMFDNSAALSAAPLVVPFRPTTILTSTDKRRSCGKAIQRSDRRIRARKASADPPAGILQHLACLRVARFAPRGFQDAVQCVQVFHEFLIHLLQLSVHAVR